MTQAAQSWVRIPPDSEFPLENLPYGVFADAHGRPHIGVAAGDSIFDLHEAAHAGLFDGVVSRAVLTAPTMNLLLAAGRDAWSALRKRIRELLQDAPALLEGVNRDALVVGRPQAKLVLPFAAGDYVDFYSSLEHATNLGKIFRPDGEPLMPNWRWIPIGYHGRTSTIVIDGTPIVRPSGQHKAPSEPVPVFGPSRLLDIELEIGFVTGPGNRMGAPIPIESARDHIFGLVLVNDWSARDIQAWEYQPLGPFLAKNFCTSISPWVVTLEALEPFKKPLPQQDPEPLPYLRAKNDFMFDIHLEARLQTSSMTAPQIITNTNFQNLYWSIAQQLAHHTVNGCNLEPGDLLASGT
ncbi:MAG TPA: fumarylacetoacetase, partial [Candidatus Baltobacteraceae bacterium]|nr:fumarylacetoacetase [Candidatus Baltobacteraceae bacterium]